MSTSEVELKHLGWRTLGGIVSTFVIVPAPVVVFDLDSPTFEKLCAYIGVTVLFLAWVACITVLAKKVWRL